MMSADANTVFTSANMNMVSDMLHLANNIFV